jgi:membrane fusion protein, multidrug efflux system
MKTKRNISLTSFALAVLLLSSCAPADPKAELEKLKQEQNELNTRIKELEAKIGTDTTLVSTGKIVEIKKMQLDTFRNYVEIHGMVDADENVNLSAEMGGEITAIYVKTGQEVTQGQLLAETDSKVIRQGIAELQNGIDLATIMFNKQKALWDQKIGSEVQFLSAKNQKEGLEKKMATLQQQLDMTRIKSPITGTVDAVMIKVGQVVAPGMPAITVVNFNNLKVKGEVPESYASRVKKGNTVWVHFPDIKDSLRGKINYAARVINPLNRTFTVEVLLNDKKEYHPNMLAILKINDYVSPKPVIIIPASVIQKSEDGKEFVIISSQKKAKKVFIKTGLKYSGQVEIVEGLNPGDELITRGFLDLNEGDELKY